ncbi:hypothetical protein RJT34_20130 [Clitoria ternatea]|uniref:Isopenicillin N synthase-like Fe(2+) 2OG dioxygenase domain-containing protein n=1 Tax=Clitoria ternatea TaxID=43366 RepID=A0AAN9ISL3_CLITE
MIENHEIDPQLMKKVKQLINTYYEEKLKESFYQSEIAKRLDKQHNTSDIDWESAFFVWHRPTSNINQIPNLSQGLCKTMDEYIAQLIKLAEKLSELMSENLGLEKDYIKKSFSGSNGPALGTKMAKYPQCPRPELVRGLREHTDAGGDQVEVLSNGLYKSVVHRIMPDKNGSRISIATFYNPIRDAIISPAPKLLYPSNFHFRDYLKLYGNTKFGEKGSRFESMKNVINSHKNILA